MAGNLRSRFTDFLTSDGEKPDRNRDGEFEIDGTPSREAILADWERGWTVLFEALDALTEEDVLLEVDDSRRAAVGRSGARSADDPPRLSRRPDCVPGQALPVVRLAQPEYPPQAIAPDPARLR